MLCWRTPWLPLSRDFTCYLKSPLTGAWGLGPAQSSARNCLLLLADLTCRLPSTTTDSWRATGLGRRQRAWGEETAGVRRHQAIKLGKCKSALTSGEDDYCYDSKAPQERRKGTRVRTHTLTRAHTCMLTQDNTEHTERSGGEEINSVATVMSLDTHTQPTKTFFCPSPSFSPQSEGTRRWRPLLHSVPPLTQVTLRWLDCEQMFLVRGQDRYLAKPFLGSSLPRCARGLGNCRETPESDRAHKHQVLSPRVWDLGGSVQRERRPWEHPNEIHRHQNPRIRGHCFFKCWEHLGDVSHHTGMESMRNDAVSSNHHPLHPWATH